MEPVLSKTWQFKVNQLMTSEGTSNLNRQKLLFELKEALQGKGFWTDNNGNATTPTGNWEVVGSSNGTTAALDGEDRILSASDFNMPDAGRWIVLRQPSISSNFEICIFSNTSSQVFISHTGFSGGTISARPTAPDEISRSSLLDTNTISNKLHFLKSSDGEMFKMLVCASGVLKMICCIEKPASSVTGWSNPSLVGGINTSNPSGVRFLSLSVLGTLSYTGYYNGSMTLLLTADGIHNGDSGPIVNYMYGGNVFNNAITLFPLGLFSTTSGKSGRHGTITDCWATLELLPDGTTFPSDGSKQLVQFGTLVLPWNGTTPELSAD